MSKLTEEIKISALNLPPRIHNPLCIHGLYNLNDLLKISPENIAKMPHFGWKSVFDLYRILQQNGYHWEGD